MKNITCYSIVAALFFLTCFCNNKTYGQPVENPKKILESFGSYWDYYNRFVKLNRDFVPLDSNKNAIPKKEFFAVITNGGFLPLRLKPKENNSYQLYKIPQNEDSDVCKTIKQMASMDYDNFAREGKLFPRFDFADLTGNHYNNENTKGKIIVMKCWFLGCHACVQEFPENNALFEKYKNDPNIIFLSLAFDDNAKLTKFLSEHPLNCHTVANQKTFLTGLKIRDFPTDIIMKDGVIIKSVNTVEDVDLELHKWVSLKQ